MPDPTPNGRRDRREARRQHRRSHTRVVALVVVAVLVIAAVAVAVTGAVSFGGGGGERAAGTVRVAPAAAAQSTTTTTSPKHPCRALTTADPLRLWVGGDSLAGSLGPALGTITGATGVVQPYFDSRVSSGLSNAGFFDWPDHAKAEMTRLDPEIVVFIIGTNDYTTPTGDDTWKTDYSKRVDEMLTALGSDGRTVYWVGAPTLKDDKMDEGAVAVNTVAAAVVAKHANAEYVDAHKLFADADGKFAQNLPDETGKLVTMRAGDGVHLTPDGADHLARAVFTPLDTQCRITAQKVAGHELATIQTEGSTQVAPNSSGNGGTVQTTPPYSSPASTTTPPTTSPPPATAAPTTTVATTPPTTVGQPPGHGPTTP